MKGNTTTGKCVCLIIMQRNIVEFKTNPCDYNTESSTNKILNNFHCFFDILTMRNEAVCIRRRIERPN